MSPAQWVLSERGAQSKPDNEPAGGSAVVYVEVRPSREPALAWWTRAGPRPEEGRSQRFPRNKSRGRNRYSSRARRAEILPRIPEERSESEQRRRERGREGKEQNKHAVTSLKCDNVYNPTKSTVLIARATLDRMRSKP